MTPEEAEQRLLSLELFGMRFGLDRMRRLMTALGHPERSFESIHVVGTNGKSSTTRMIAAILARHGRRTGSYLSPHLVGFNERIRVTEQDITPQRFADAIERTLRAAEQVNRASGGEDPVTQFELLTAAAYSELAADGVDVAVVEAGLGGRYDATNVIPSKVQVLTSVGLEHTRWLGPTITAIAREKLDVVRPGGTLVLGAGMHPDALAVAERVAAERGASIVQAEADPHATVGALGNFQRRNFALARAAAEAFLGPLDGTAVEAAAADVRVPGRMQVVDHEPLTLLDGAHNPDGITALTESLPEIIAAGAYPASQPPYTVSQLPYTASQPPYTASQPPRHTVNRCDDSGGERAGRVVAVVSILDDKDAAGMLRSLAPLCDALVLTSSHNPRVLPPPTLSSLLDQLAPEITIDHEIVPGPHAALRRARELAGPDGVVVATGSLYLISDLMHDEPAGGARRASML